MDQLTIPARTLCAVIMVLQSACATQPASVPRPADLTRARLGTVAVADVRFEPRSSLEADVRGKEAGAGAGAGSAALGCLRMGGGGSGGGVGALVILVCMPIAAVVGGVYGAAHAAPQITVDQAEKRFQAAFLTLAPQQNLAKHLVWYAKKNGITDVTLLYGEGPASLEEAPTYRPPGGRAVQTVLEVGITELTAITSGRGDLPYFFRLKARGRLVRARDNAVLDSFTIIHATAIRTADGWLADNGKALLDEFDRGYERIAEAFVDEWMLVNHAPPSTKDETATPTSPAAGPRAGEISEARELVPGNVLRPVHPAVTTAFNIFARPRFAAALDPARLDTLRPIFRWDPYPRAHQALSTASAPGRAGTVTYDFRIFPGAEQQDAYGLLVPQARTIVDRVGLTAPEYQLKQALEPCTYYFWTARARFTLDGYPQVTEWSGAYNTIGGMVEPGAGRRQVRSLSGPQYPPAAVYFPFRTPPAFGITGKTC